MPVPLSQDVADQLSGPVRAGERFVIPRLALDDGSEVSLALEAFDVFAPGATIIEYTDHGPRWLAPPADSYFRGSVIGDPDSLVVLASGRKLRGFIYTSGRVYAIAPDRNVYGDDRVEPVSHLRQVDAERDRPVGMLPFHCGAESLSPPPGSRSVTAFGMPISVQPMWTSTVYTVNLAIETDYELRQQFSSTDAEVRYLGDLTAAASAIYWRDVKTVFQIGTVHLWTTSSDPWSATDMEGALDELGDYWHANYAGVARTIAYFVSGKNLGGGIAWLGVLCGGDFQFQGCDANGQNCVTHWGGAYGLSGNHAGVFSVTNPNQYWDILAYTHEIGHNFSSPHTHCFPTPIDHCYNSESGCYSGPLCVNGTSDPCNIGTIMSYCHLRAGGYNNLTMTFGQQGQLSQQVLDTMRGYVESKAACLMLMAAAPTVTGVSPPSGSTSGGTSLTISGTGFQYYATVTIGGVNATNVNFVNSTTITATTGPHAAGTVNVVVQNPDSQTGTGVSAFTYGAGGLTVSLSLNRSALYFGATTGGAMKTSGQEVIVSTTGGALGWLVTANGGFLQVSPGSGSGSGKFTVSIVPGSYPTPGISTGSVIVAAPGAANSPQTIQVTLKVYTAGTTGVPFGYIDSPGDGVTGITGAVAFTGWALDDIEVTKVELWRDPFGAEPPTNPNGLVYIGVATITAGQRPDVEAAYPTFPMAYRAAWGYNILTNLLPSGGNGVYRVHVYVFDAEGHRTYLGAKRFTASNATATKPFGTIDTPAQGATISGGAYVSWGWALTPLPSTIPADGSSIWVYIDGVQVGHPSVGYPRSDIDSLFPGLNNSGAGVRYYMIDTTTLSNGVHTIVWGVVDNNGNAEGLGSRYFWVLN
jgi:hypothetical protein